MTLTERVEELATVMRRVGAVRAEITKTGIKLELGSEPQKPLPEQPPKSDEQILIEAAKLRKEAEKFLFAASEGYPIEVDE